MKNAILKYKTIPFNTWDSLALKSISFVVVFNLTFKVN